MIEKVVEETFKAMFALTDLRQIIRQTKPLYNLDKEQRFMVQAIIAQIKQSLSVIEKEFI